MVDMKSMAKASRARRTNDGRGLLGLPQSLSEENTDSRSGVGVKVKQSPRPVREDGICR